MKHSRAMFLLESHQRDEFKPADRQALDSHMAGCSDCALEAHEMASLQDFCRQAAGHMPAGFDGALEAVRQRTLRAIRTEPRKSFDPVRWIRALGPIPLAVPAAAAVIVVLLVVARPERTPERVMPPSDAPRAGLVPPSIDHGVPPSSVPEGTAASKAEAAGLPSVEVRTTTQVARRSIGGKTQEGPREFLVVRTEAEIRIEWPQGARSHRIRKALDPASVQVAGGQLVTGTVWSDPETHPVPGSVTFYLVD